MTLADQKKKENIAEYLLFLWQMEDLVRAMYFDMDALADFIKTYTPNEEAYQEELIWFKDLVRKMRSERVEQRGHVAEVHELIFELTYLHNTMLTVVKDKDYQDAHRQAQPNIKDYLSRSDGKATNDIEVCLTALYGLLVLRLKKEPISGETQQAINTFTNLLARLSHHYRLMKRGEMNFALN
jgi:hypothetical protein